MWNHRKLWENLHQIVARPYFERGWGGARDSGNWNNQIGVPITLLGLDPLKDRFSVVEAGINQRGEMASLAQMIEGDLTIVTTIGAAHLEQLLDLETVAKEKSQLARYARANSPIFMPAALLDYAAFGRLSSRVWALYSEKENQPQNSFRSTQVTFESGDSVTPD